MQALQQRQQGRASFRGAAMKCAAPRASWCSSRTRQQQRASRMPLVCRASSPNGEQDEQASSSQQFDIDAGKPEKLQVELPDDGPREDDVLPDSLADAVAQAAAATAAALRGGASRCQVEILLPEFWDPISGPIFPNKGDQERFWRMTRRFIEALAEQTQIGAVKAVYPDAGVAAMLSYQWQERSFKIDSLNARRPVSAADELVVLACPDPPGADDALRLVRTVSEQDEQAGTLERPVVLFNQRLSSGDVGIGLNARRIRENFLQRFAVTYSLRPVGEIGTVFRKYPGQWQVFVEESAAPGRYFLAAEQPNRPAGEALDYIIAKALGVDLAGEGGVGSGGGGAAGLLGSLAATMASMQRFMRSLSN